MAAYEDSWGLCTITNSQNPKKYFGKFTYGLHAKSLWQNIYLWIGIQPIYYVTIENWNFSDTMTQSGNNPNFLVSINHLMKVKYANATH